MDKKKQEFAMLVFSGLMLIMISLITPTNGSVVREYFMGFMTGMGIVTLLLAAWTLGKNKGFRKAE